MYVGELLPLNELFDLYLFLWSEDLIWEWWVMLVKMMVVQLRKRYDFGNIYISLFNIFIK